MTALDAATSRSGVVRGQSPLLLRIDASAGLFAGGSMLAVEEWLSAVYAMPLDFYRFVAFANLAYGLFSLWLVTRSRRPRTLIHLLVFANGAWAAVCVGLAVLLWNTAEVWGLAHLTLEGAFVGALAVLEWRRRESFSS